MGNEELIREVFKEIRENINTHSLGGYIHEVLDRVDGVEGSESSNTDDWIVLNSEKFAMMWIMEGEL